MGGDYVMKVEPSGMILVSLPKRSQMALSSLPPCKDTGRTGKWPPSIVCWCFQLRLFSLCNCEHKCQLIISHSACSTLLCAILLNPGAVSGWYHSPVLLAAASLEGRWVPWAPCLPGSPRPLLCPLGIWVVELLPKICVAKLRAERLISRSVKEHILVLKLWNAPEPF